jgi:hypothetical protein
MPVLNRQDGTDWSLGVLGDGVDEPRERARRWRTKARSEKAAKAALLAVDYDDGGEPFDYMPRRLSAAGNST